MTQSVPANISFPEEEEKILQLWNKLDAFKTSIKQSKGKPRYTFYDGPPFATGLPHYGHMLAGTIKDIIPRYYHQRGYHVERRFGWDTHGLPVEQEIDKMLGIKGPEDVARMGIAAYNAECRKIVMRYSSEWRTIMGRLGRWIDFDNDYKSLYPWFMESVWWVFKQLWDKGLIYEGFRVMDYSTGMVTPLSNFEVQQNYKEVTDADITVTFPLDEDPTVCFIAWTTTHWTLPSNMALCVHPDMDYVKLTETAESGRTLIMMETCVPNYFKSPDDYNVVARFKGIDLKGKSYAPLFPYYAHYKPKGAFRVVCDSYVLSDAGTGVVHQSPYYGEDDYRICLSSGIISADQDIVCPLDDCGKFRMPAKEFLGEYFKDAVKKITKRVKSDGRFFSEGQTKHRIAFCWRTDTPLVKRAIPSWFMRVEQMQDRLLERLEETRWVPENIKEGRFTNWLRGARDWNLSRNRYWGTPIPIWQSADKVESVCIGSVAELERLSGVKVTDLHRENVDDVTIPSARPGQPPLRRVKEVFDCWFESGSMPYAQKHYPFENKKEFEESFPADFVAEGTDQTRGWFYTLLVLSTALFDKPPYKNLICSGLILAADGQKMSKSKRNFPDPLTTVNKYGADAIRLYLINSPVVKAETLRFKEDGVRDVLKDVFLPWFNAYRFLLQGIESYERETSATFSWSESGDGKSSPNVMDRWILSFTQSLLKFITQEMEAYRLYTVLPKLMKYIDNLTKWYVRMNRRRLKGEAETCVGDRHAALHTLFAVIFTMVRVFAPFTPFFTEYMYQSLRRYADGFAEDTAKDSVHYVMLPSARDDLIDAAIERAVATMQNVVDLGRVIRDRKTMSLKYPLPELVVIHRDSQCLADIKDLEDYIKADLNVRKVTLSTDKQQYGVVLRAEPDHKTLGAKLKGAFKDVMREIKALDDASVTKFVETGSITLLGHELGPDDLRVRYSFAGDKQLAEKYEADSNNDLLLLLDVTPDKSMLDEGVAREVVNRVQKMRKKCGLCPTDAVSVYFTLSPADHALAAIIDEHRAYIEDTTKSPIRSSAATERQRHRGKVIAEESHDVKGAKLELVIMDGFCGDFGVAGAASRGVGLGAASRGVGAASRGVGVGVPATPFVNVSHGSRTGVVLLENPLGAAISGGAHGLLEQAKVVFGLQGNENVKLFSSEDGQEMSNVTSLASLNGKWLEVGAASPKARRVAGSICCPFVNVVHGGDGGAASVILLENPSGVVLPADDVAAALLGTNRTKLAEESGGVVIAGATAAASSSGGGVIAGAAASSSVGGVIAGATAWMKYAGKTLRVVVGETTD